MQCNDPGRSYLIAAGAEILNTESGVVNRHYMGQRWMVVRSRPKSVKSGGSGLILRGVLAPRLLLLFMPPPQELPLLGELGLDIFMSRCAGLGLNSRSALIGNIPKPGNAG